MTKESGAETLVHTLLAGGVDVCFTNPGTSEMHFVAALDKIEGMRCVLGLFEGVVTGAADGYYRIADKPAATLLHLAPGLGNGVANLHNAKKARSGIVNIVGDHATYCAHLDTPLSGDIEGVARPVSNWVRTTTDGDHLAADAAEAVRLARQSPGRIATLVLPADVSWGPGGAPAAALAPLPRRPVRESAVAAAADALRAAGSAGVLLLGDAGTRARSLEWAGRIAARTGCKLLTEIHSSRIERGAGRVAVDRIPYTQPVDNALRLLADKTEMVLAGAEAPVSFFAYPGKPVELAPPSCAIRTLAEPGDDVEAALEALARALGAEKEDPGLAPLAPPECPTGPITLEGLGAVIGALLPDNAIVVDEAVTSGRSFYKETTNAPPHDWLVSRGASIGFAPPAAVGAAIAAPDRKVLALTGDGSGMYTLQALWTMAREGLDVTIVVFANRKYQILRGEFANMGSGVPGPRAEAMLSIGDPALDWCALATGHGVANGRAETLDEFADQLRQGFAARGPYLVEVVL
ncbi:MAG: acetolactate synthase large subunit [Sphingopyxis macrogoltabida]|uniref:Acetolactate synthase large subunit n=1 Tax=Sphingopyxis macrogoltabida TaxID=33050 RepID=A0A2W5L8G1_SPHMC|nr:MAG: acetolactate synthase large subunit [Sphingopyxis macrogoltabida]